MLLPDDITIEDDSIEDDSVDDKVPESKPIMYTRKTQPETCELIQLNPSCFQILSIAIETP